MPNSRICNNCGTNDIATTPLAQHEKDQERLMKIIKWLVAVIILLIVLLVGAFSYIGQFETVETIKEETYEVNAENGGSAVYNNDGSVNING